MVKEGAMDQVSPVTLTAGGAALASSPWWVELIYHINLFAGAVTMITGAIIGIVGVYRLFKGKDNGEDDAS